MKFKDFKILFRELDLETFNAYKEDRKDAAGRVDWFGLYLDLESKYNC